MNDKKIIDFTQGNPAKLIIRFYIPLFLTSLLQQVYNFVDVLIVGKGLGDSAFASVGNMSSLFFLIVGFSFGLANGFGVLIAQSFGAKKYDELRHRVAGTIQLACVMAILLTTISIIFLPNALRLLRTDKALMANCLRYGYIIFGGLFTSICYNISAAILRALGDSRTPLKAIITSSIINLVLDSLFIFAFGMGVEGAAIATVISQVISSIVCIHRIRQIELLRLRRSDFNNERSVYTTLFANGLPNAFMYSITAIGCMVVQFFINGFGVAYTTAYSACSKYLNLFMNPASTAGNAMSAYASQNYGAREYGRIREGLKVCLSIALVAYLLLGSLMVFAPGFLAGILLDGEEPIRLANQFLPICGVSIIAVDFLFVLRSGVQGMGNPVVPMWSGALEMILRIAVITLLIGKIGIRAAALAEVSAWTGALIVNSVTFCKMLLPKLGGEHELIFLRKKRRVY